MLIPLSSIHLTLKDRLRAQHMDIQGLAVSIARVGQLQAILVRPREDGEEFPEGKEYALVAGARRFLAVSLISKSEVECKYGPPRGQIFAETREGMDELLRLEVEFRENEDRDNFTWQDRAGYIKRVHDLHCEREKGWTPGHTAAVLEMGESTVYKYLEFHAHPDILQQEAVQDTTSFRTAYKQFKIALDLQKRKKEVEHREKREEEKKTKKKEAAKSRDPLVEVEEEEVQEEDHTSFAARICSLGDCRDWIKQFDSRSFDWIHWDPPYGGEQGGGARPTHKKIDDTWDNAYHLMLEMMPEIYRVLKSGRWMALWLHPMYLQEISRLVAGHVRDGDICVNCGKVWKSNELGQVCVRGEWAFWVNPYPNIWYKVDRKSDGHEITKYLTNAYEMFILCCKQAELSEPILTKSDRQNVFVFPGVTKSERRHVMHKPPPLIEKILECISIQGEFGCDPSFGSGSSVEAALNTGRRIVACELDEDIYHMGQKHIEEVIFENGILPYDIPLVSHSEKSEDEELEEELDIDALIEKYR